MLPRAAEFDNDITLVARNGVASAAQLQRAYQQAIQRQRDQYGPAQSTLMAVDCLLKRDDRQALQDFIAEHRPSQAKDIIAYARGRTCLGP